MLFTFPVLGHEFRTGVFQEIPWLKLLEYIPFSVLLLWGLFRGSPFSRGVRFPPRDPFRDHPDPQRGRLHPRLFGSSARSPVDSRGHRRGWVVRPTARWKRPATMGARVVRAGLGRGVQVRAAAETAKGDVLLILHADAILTRDAPEQIIRALAADRATPGGYFRMAFAAKVASGGSWLRSTT